ncbi:MAG: CubicO group peptidase (beta-lactamase class C family) [Halioglobus sp.]|jgi:CubicO group peptidase (beta-lactamase class C family)
MSLQKYLLTLLFSSTLLAGNVLAQSVTIGGTAAQGEATGFSALFVGDRFENFRNMARFMPTSEMSPSPEPWDLGKNSNTLDYTGSFLDKPTTLAEFIGLSDTSAFLVIKDGEIIYENYTHGDSRDSLHISFSMAKSFTSALLGIALDEGKLDSLDDPIRKYLPELTSAAFDDVTIKQVLQMSSGIRFNEAYTDPESDINKMTTMVPPMSYLEYINTLGREHPPGTFNHYASINTQLLGILLVKITGTSLTDYMTSRLWQPLGMEHVGQWILDEEGYELVMGGLSASARDYAKLGLLYLNNGEREGHQVLPRGWVKASVTPDEPHLMPGENAQSSNVSGYQYQWWTPRDWDGDFLARGIWGQNIYVHPGNRVVIVKLGADQKNFDLRYKLAYIDYLQDLAQSLDD